MWQLQARNTVRAFRKGRVSEACDVSPCGEYGDDAASAGIELELDGKQKPSPSPSSLLLSLPKYISADTCTFSLRLATQTGTCRELFHLEPASIFPPAATPPTQRSTIDA
jgi:hypothetical protein